ncbi:condensation domain-containing protein [Streptomyces sp. NPDC088788]|uniref:condensation domain-containing protein n=1 Tax=Streptomyces sp. NPDC088788 TaxID=3365898 RepID=UPI003819EB9C
MTTNRFARLPQREPITVVVDLGPGAAPVLELCGPLPATRIEAALDTITARHPDARAWKTDLDRPGPGRHTVRFSTTDGPDPADFPLGALADLLTRAGRGAFTTRHQDATLLQRELLAAADAHPGPGRQVEQASFDWHGPLDVPRFTTAWHSVFARESVLRTAFDDQSEDALVVHDRPDPQVVHLTHDSAEWHTLVASDRRRGIDPRRPAPLRVTLLGGESAEAADLARTGPARVLLTYHHALLDSWSVRLLVREFYRAYLAGGELPGGQRRPDMSDYTAWLATQDTTAAKDFFTHTDAGADATDAVRVPPLFTDTAHRTEGRSRLRLTQEETARLADWAARWGGAESTALQAVWSLLLYRAGRAEGPCHVRFATTTAGRGILFEGIERTPGALAGPLPQSVLVDPHATVAQLMTHLRDHCLDQAAYEWVTAGQIHAWTRRPAPPADTLLTFETLPHALSELDAELAAHGIEVEPPQTLGAHTAYPLTLTAHHDSGDRLVLTASYDQARFCEITELLAHAALLLRELPRGAGPGTTLGDVLALLTHLGTDPAPGPVPATQQESPPPPAVLRPPAHPRAATLALLQAPGRTRAFYDRIARAYPGPENLLLLAPLPAGGAHAATAARAAYDALAPHLRPGTGRPVLAAFCGDGVAACTLARLAAADGHRPRAVVLDTTTTDPDDLAHRLAAAARRHP